ncbi:MAG: hypothetical protein A2700_00220 [Candidatus Blackburnbacteria bacterium RIFCSPHIGHO2_01_FULL_44_64]|nr:MAG: hypothetical protein A2700_00220 [Candidatus Blackburnbacteria bacterium RIFCSPHIGHO2_01_FULL_44_64]OGY15341.1 MAG: hypothetical protein A3H88_00390 [Candidatus Blackburnbacteria bacterium RIFCSPLOWO2_02_FULL_44_9]
MGGTIPDSDFFLANASAVKRAAVLRPDSTEADVLLTAKSISEQLGQITWPPPDLFAERLRHFQKDSWNY